MEIASNKGVITDASTPAGRAGMSESEWREAIKFDSTDTGWVIMSIGMAIGAGLFFSRYRSVLMGLWVFLLSSVIGYPANVSVSSGCLLIRWQNHQNVKITRVSLAVI